MVDILADHLEFMESIHSRYEDFMCKNQHSTQEEFRAMYHVEHKRVLDRFEHLLYKYHTKGNTLHMHLNFYHREEMDLLHKYYFSTQ